jgi:hypothetical protein
MRAPGTLSSANRRVAPLRVDDCARPGSRAVWIAVLLLAVLGNLAFCMGSHRHAAPAGDTSQVAAENADPGSSAFRSIEPCAICSALAACALLFCTQSSAGLALALRRLRLAATAPCSARRQVWLPDSRGPPHA